MYFVERKYIYWKLRWVYECIWVSKMDRRWKEVRNWKKEVRNKEKK